MSATRIDHTTSSQRYRKVGQRRPRRAAPGGLHAASKVPFLNRVAKSRARAKVARASRKANR